MKRLLCLVAVCACSRNDEPPKRELVAPQAELMGTVASDVMAAPRGPGVTQKLYADDVPAGTLPLSISIETIGDVASVIMPRGTKRPTSHTEVFSTALDDQDRVQIHVLQGERPLASQNRTLGKFQLFGIPPAPRGVPQIEVTFAIDADGLLTVSARDKGTGQSKQILIDAMGDKLDKAAIDKLLADAAAAKPDDDRSRAWAKAKNELDAMIYACKSLLTSAGARLSKKTRARIEREIAGAENVLALSTKPMDPKLLVAVTETLRQIAHKASEEMYGVARKQP